LKLDLLDALHARPASLFVRVASQFAATIEVCKEGRSANGKNILDVLALGAAKGQTIELFASGNDAEAALAALTALIERNFDADLVPETGTLAASGIAVGRAVVMPPTTKNAANPPDIGESHADDASGRLHAAFGAVIRDLERMVDALPRAEATLFEPEIAIVRALESPVLARVARGERVEDALRAATSSIDSLAPSSREPSTQPRRGIELVMDARDRLLDAYTDQDTSRLTRLLAQTPDGEVILITEEVTPSLVAAVPERVVGIVAASDQPGDTSHAAILARGRGVPLVFVSPHVALSITDHDMIVLDASTPAPRLWLTPSAERIAEARAARAQHSRAASGDSSRPIASLSHLPRHDGAPFAVRVNVGSIYDGIPAGAHGIGLVRTELFFAARSRPPSAEDQLATLLLLAGKVNRGPVVARLFDAGGDKPLSWLPPPATAPQARGIDLLRRHPEILRAQIAAIARAAERADVHLLIPLVRHGDDVAAVRSLAPPRLPIGAMIETPAAVAETAEIASAADFICIGTNDLAALAHGQDRATAMAAPADPRILSMIVEVVRASHHCRRRVTVCGEIAGDPHFALVLAGLDVDAISVAPSRFAAVKNALVSTTPAACVEAARQARGKGSAP
jgi:phosphocarrier protein FPr